MIKEEQLLVSRFRDLAHMADSRGIVLFSDFLNLHEQNLFYQIKNELPDVKYLSYGGYGDAERKILCFCGDFSVDNENGIEFPIACLHITPKNPKFSDKLTHRDILGAVLNLGIERCKTGDIIVDNNEAYIFCCSSICDFIISQLERVKHTMVGVSIIDIRDFKYEPKLRPVTGTVSSVRLDSVLSVAFNGSRSSLSGLIAGGKVFVNGKNVLSNSYNLKENDIVSVRGYGRFIFAGTMNQTKKGRYLVKVLVYE